MIRQELNPETCKLVTKHTKNLMVTSKEPDTRVAQFFVSNGPDTRMTQVHFGSKEPDTRMAQGSFWFQGARHKNGFVSNGPDTGMTQVHVGSKEPDAGMAHVHTYIYIYSCLQAAHAGAHGQQGRYVFSTRHQALRWPLPGDG